MSNLENFQKSVIFYGIRFGIVALAIYIGYIFVKKFIVPKILDDMCLTNTNNCITMKIYFYKNTFLAQEQISQIWFWYDGNKLYIYGQSPEKCIDPDVYMPANIFQLSRKNDEIIFTPFPTSCVTKIETIQNYYENLNVIEEFIYLKKYDEGSYTTNIFDIIKSMIDNKIFSV